MHTEVACKIETRVQELDGRLQAELGRLGHANTSLQAQGRTLETASTQAAILQLWPALQRVGIRLWQIVMASLSAFVLCKVQASSQQSDKQKQLEVTLRSFEDD